MSRDQQQLALPEGAREIIIACADGLPPVDRERFLDGVADALMQRAAPTNADVIATVSVVRRRMLGLAAMVEV